MRPSYDAEVDPASSPNVTNPQKPPPKRGVVHSSRQGLMSGLRVLTLERIEVDLIAVDHTNTPACAVSYAQAPARRGQRDAAIWDPGCAGPGGGGPSRRALPVRPAQAATVSRQLGGAAAHGRRYPGLGREVSPDAQRRSHSQPNRAAERDRLPARLNLQAPRLLWKRIARALRARRARCVGDAEGSRREALAGRSGRAN